ncbi:hypothetical protein ACU75N_003969 [Yersinia enterocolitica]|uniref:TraP protein n=1 Tax=Yersinia intermedia TaxID=631 RepID=A0A0T9MTE5_YERIN|nr:MULTISPECIES: hypothetical protein [Yersinia]EKN6368076.1 hypothetical protein [Yersinia enterocolitica]OVZ88193.1 hypothetical protein CBW58_19825 [Yersinia frederiksenii]MCB5319915.1 hypothetical protein [Yersinia massiliensis]CNG45165.1 Uncharacterised protein [Yersinia intermedia]HDL6708945.1 hypothetical protein [Yersinia enterocolitica]
MTTSHFDLETPPVDLPENEPEVTQTPIASKPTHSKLITLPFGLKVAPLQAGMMGLVIVGIVAFGVLRNAPSSTGASPQFAAQEPITTPPIVPVPYSPPSTSVQNTTIDAPPTREPVASTLTEPSPQIVEELRVYGENNREGIKALDQRLRLLEQQVAYLAQRPSPASVSTMTTASAVAPKASHRTASKNSGLRGASINSLYPGLAWVTYQGSTWALQPGDRIGHATVQRIDTQNREVITTAGVIR